MKLLLLVLTIAVCYSFPLLGGYQMVDVTEAQSSLQIQSLIQYGLQSIVQESIQDGKISSSSSSFSLSSINSVYLQVLDTQNYKFNCDFVNADGLTLNSNFQVNYQDSTDAMTIASSSYSFQELDVSQAVQQTFSEVSSAEIQYSSEIQDILQYGAQQASQQAIAQGKFQQATYTISKVNSVYRQIVTSALFYKCDVDITDDQGTAGNALFIVYYQPLENQTSLVDYSCRANEQDTQASGSVTNIAPIQNQYTDISLEQVKNDHIIQNVLNYGVDQVTQVGISQSQIPSSKYNLTQVLSASSQILGSGVYYNFICQLTSQQSDSVESTFTVYYQTITDQKSLTSYSYQVQNSQSSSSSNNAWSTAYNTNSYNAVNIASNVNVASSVSSPQNKYTTIDIAIITKDSFIYGLAQFGIDTIVSYGVRANKVPESSFTISQFNNAYKETESAVALYTFNCQAQNEAGSTIQASYTVSYQKGSDTKTLKDYYYYVQTAVPVTYTVPVVNVGGTYTQLDQSAITYDQNIQNVISSSTSQIISVALQAGKITTSDFTLTSINNAAKQYLGSGINYQCQVVLTSESTNTVMSATFVSFYNYATQQVTISSYSYNTQQANIAPSSPSPATAIAAVVVAIDTTSAVEPAVQPAVQPAVESVVQPAVQPAVQPTSRTTSCRTILY